jgi:CheY-like chemotaxis protein
MSTSRKILLIDDNDDFRGLLRELLVANGHTVSEASEGDEAIRMFDSDPPDVAIVDLNIPVRDGVELTKHFKSQIPAIHVIMVTGYAEFYSPKEILSAGIDHFLQKPVDPASILSLLDRL